MRDPHRIHHRIHRAFTLIELLVVIAIIAILASMTMSVVGMVRASAQSTACAGNLRQFGLGFAVYVEDNAQVWPTGQWHQLLQDYLNEGGTIGNGANITALFKLCRCPRAPAKTTAGMALNATYAYTGHYYDSWTYTVPYYFAWQLVPTSPVIHDAQIKRRASKCVLSESWDDLNANPAQASWGKSQLCAQNVALMHRNGSNFLAADCHVQFSQLPGFRPFTPTYVTDDMWFPLVDAPSLILK